MKQLQYVIRYLLKTRGNNLIKIVSLTLGLFVGLILFAQVAFEMSYDNFYPDKEQLYLLHIKASVQGKDGFEGGVVHAPFAPTMYREFPEVISAANAYAFSWERRFKWGETTFEEKTLSVDSLFFQTMGFPVLEGNPEELKMEDAVFVSRSFAEKVFGNIMNAVGQRLISDEQTYQVRGVFEDLPKNGHLQFEVATSLTSWTKGAGWRNNDAYACYLRLASGTDINTIPDKIREMRLRHYDVEALEREGVRWDYYVKPVTELHSGDPVVHRTCLILSLLAFSLLVASALNYVLISISSLATRAKSVGVHKCNGASEGNIFAMFIYETFVLIIVSLLITIVLILLFQKQIEVLVKTDLSAIFSLEHWWVVGAVIVVLMLITGIIPAKIFSSLPVSLVFRSYKDSKRTWKRSLLFMQFGGVSFLMTLLGVIVLQYHMMLNRELGFDTEGVICTEGMYTLSKNELQAVKHEFLSYPGVESVTLTQNLPTGRWSGQSMKDPVTEEILIHTRFTSADSSYFKTLGIRVLMGRNFNEESWERREVIVNQTFVRQLNVENPIGMRVSYFDDIYTICGVVNDFQYRSFFEEIPAIAFVPIEFPYCNSATLALRLNREITPELLIDMNERLKELSHKEDYMFTPYFVTYAAYYKDVRLFRDSVIVAGLIMLVITLLGLFGYITDEVHRRSKEIAIRKVNGATSMDILRILSVNISFIAIPSILIGLGFAYMVGTEWLKQFAVKIPLSIALFAGCGFILWLIIQMCLVLRAWNVANENPVKSIKSE